MNGAHIHLVLTHLPIVGVPLTLALYIYGRLRGCEENQRAALIGMLCLSALTVAAKLTGEGAEDVLKALPDYPRSWVHSHEEMADKATLATVALGIAALVVFMRRSTGRGLAALIIFLATLSSGLLIYTGALGGQVRHTEIRESSSGILVKGNSGRTDE